MALRIQLCQVDDVVEGELRGHRVTGVIWPVMITMVDGELIAFPGVCPHDDVSLVDYGVLEDEKLVCRVHGYRFDLRTGRCEHSPALYLRRYRITILGAAVWVDLL
jgi:nitrite reductase/ring-hydroxylating ferredoxin subunit